jgi:hypothetical protein
MSVDRDKIAETVRDHVRIYWPDLEPRYGSCLHHSLIGLLELQKHGIEAQLQAGSISWPIIHPEDDDGVCNTHFSMMWEPHNPTSMQSVMTGGIPEMHAWLGIPETQTLIDFATHEIKNTCGGVTDLAWNSDDPPDYLWVTGEELPPGVIYRPDMGATKFAYSLWPALWETRVKPEKEEE